MDPKVKAVFDLYDARAADEEQLRQRAMRGEIAFDRDAMLISVGPAVGRLLNLLIKGAGARRILEIGTSYGYSTLWLAEAARATSGKVLSLDVAPAKQAYAADMLAKAGLAEVVEFQCGDARDLIPELAGGVDFVLLDLWKDLYVPCLELFFGKLAPGAVVAADNMLRPVEARPDALAYRRAVRAKPGVSSVLLKIGQGIELSRLADEADVGV
jgi:predicted O-methyltransferase YrrM